MKNRRLALAGFGTSAILGLAVVAACGKSTTPTSTKTSDQSYAFYVGTDTSTFYLLSMYCNRGYKVTGKLFVVLKKDASGAVQDCEIGMSAVTQTPMTLPAGDILAYREPTLAATSIDYHDRLGLTGTVALLSSWSNPYDHFKSVMTNSIQTSGAKQFVFQQGNSPGGVGYNEYWAFAYSDGSIGGYVSNTDKTYCLGRDSDASRSPLKAYAVK